MEDKNMMQSSPRTAASPPNQAVRKWRAEHSELLESICTEVERKRYGMPCR